MPREITAIPTTGAAAHIGAAAFLAVVAYPDELAKRDAVIDAARALLDRYAPREHQRYRHVRAEVSESVLHAMARRICRQRLPAVHAMLWSAQPAAGVRWIARALSPARIDGRRRPETHDAARDVRKRIVRPTRAVLHLACVLNGLVVASGGRLRVDDMILRPEWLPEAVTRSEALRSAFARMPEPLRIPEDETIQLRAR